MKNFFILLLLLLYGQVLFLNGTVSFSLLKERVESIGGMKFKEDVNIKYLKESEFNSFVHSRFSRNFPENRIKKVEIFLNLMGFMKNRIPFKDILERIYMNNAGVFYNEDSGELIVSEVFGKKTDRLNELILVYELRRIVVDQYFHINRLLKKISDYDDRKLSVLAYSCGDAMLVLSLYAKIYTPFPVEPGISDSGYISDSLLSFSPIKFSYNLDGIPGIVKRYLTMPYIQGLGFAFNILKRKRSKSLNMVFSAPPNSTEQILHVKKYIKKDHPVDVKISYDTPGSYKLFHSGVIGEYLLNILLKSGDDYTDFASGWGGDKFRLFLSGGKYILVWKSVWDNEKDSEKFFYIFRSWLKNRYSLTFRKGNKRGNPFIAGRSDGEYFFLRVFKKKMFYMKTSDREVINKFIEGGVYD